MAENYIGWSPGTGTVSTTSSASTSWLFKVNRGPTLGVVLVPTTSYVTASSTILIDGGPGIGLTFAAG